MKFPASLPAIAVTLTLTWGTGLGQGRSAVDRIRPAITLRVVNEGGIDPRVLVLAQKEAVRIFAHSGIDLIWLSCVSGRAEGGFGSPCTRDLGANEFWMRMVARKPPAVTDDMLAFSEMDESRGTGSAGVYYPTAVAMAAWARARVGEIVAAGVAHEVGHLLLGVNSHSPDGVMCAHWGPREFQLIGVSGLHFTDSQSKLLQERIETRESGQSAAAH